MVLRRASASWISSPSRTIAPCTRRGASCCAASVGRKRPATPTAVRWRWSTTTPSGACLSGGWRNSEQPRAQIELSHHLDDNFPFGTALLEVGKRVRDSIEREHAVGDDFERPFVDQLGQEREAITAGV